MNIEKIQNGYLFQGEEYIFTAPAEILNESQADVFTNKGIILFDTNITVNGKSFETIEKLIEAIK
jgi:hypothetical protein